MPDTLFHLAAQADWQRPGPTYVPAAYATDGFIHCSTAQQLPAVANRFYRGREDLVLLRIAPGELGAEVRFENLEGGTELYPHLYGELPRSAVIRALPLKPDADGGFTLRLQDGPGRLCVFCGSSTGVRPEYLDAARSLGAALAKRGIGLVYGGASVGLMGAVADAALDAGGEVIGVIPTALWEKEIAHRDLTELRVVGSMHERKAQMAELSDGFVALPGGIGTLEELFEVWTWSQLGLHRKPVALLNVAGYYTPLLQFLDSAVTERFLRAEHRGMLVTAKDPETLLTRVGAYRPPGVTKWLDRAAT
jgi:uncharacterized protein (TIGR00730 family)